MGKGVELFFRQEMIVEYRLGKVWMREARLYTEERAKFV